MTLFQSSSSSRSLLSVLALGAFALAAAACSSTTSGTSGSSGTGTSGTSGTGTSGGATVSAADCQSRCEKKFTTCGGDSASATSGCSQQVCNASLTGDQLTCLENKSCDDIAGASSVASLCPASTTTTPPTNTGATCGTATCSATQYCALSYDTSTQAWNPTSCKALPTACASKGASELCTCMKDNSGCSTSGVISTKCNQSNGALSFGCN